MTSAFADFTRPDLTYQENLLLHPSPAMWTMERVASELGLTDEQFKRKKKKLHDDGFPLPHPVTGTYVGKEVLLYISHRPSMLPNDDDFFRGMEIND